MATGCKKNKLRLAFFGSGKMKLTTNSRPWSRKKKKKELFKNSLLVCAQPDSKDRFQFFPTFVRTCCC